MLKPALDYDPVVTLKLESQPYLLPLCGVWANRTFPIEGYDPNALEAVQLEDGSTAYIHHPVAVPSDSTILAVQTEVGLEDLAAEDDEGFSTDTVVALEQYASKVSLQSLTLPINSLDSAKTATSLEDKVSPFLGHGLCPSTQAPPTGLSHMIVHGVHHSLTRGCQQLFTLTLIYAVSAEGRQLYETVTSSWWGFRPSFTLTIVIILCAV